VAGAATPEAAAAAVAVVTPEEAAVVAATPEEATVVAATPEAAARVSKKDQILTLYRAGITEVADLAAITLSRPSYVASVLQEAKLLPGYFDLYTTSERSMNVYSQHFAGQLGFRDEEAARASLAEVRRIDRVDVLGGLIHEYRHAA
jgi:hypothetical protein